MSKNKGAMQRGLAALAIGLLVVSFAAFAKPSNKWRIEMDGRAKADGEIELSFVPEGGTATNVVVAIPGGTGENDAARLLRDRLRETFGSDVYKVEVDDGEDVLVKTTHGSRDFDLLLVRNTAEGLRAKLERE